MTTENTLKTSQFLYLISFNTEFAELCAMEMRHIFGTTTTAKYHFSDELIDISRSTFLKGVITVLYTDSNIQQIENQITKDQLTVNNYKINFVKLQEVSYIERIESMRTLGTAILGDFAIKDPDVQFILTKIDDIWIFGQLYANKNKWRERRQKPHNYSHALDVKLAKAVINIAISNNFNLSVIDPCCGIGTVIIEGRASGVNISGYEINPLVKQHCNLNLDYFGFAPNVTKTDMLLSQEHFDVAILDLPYGHTSFITKEEQTALLKKTKEISNKSVIITMEDMSDIMISLGMNIIDTCKIKKSNAFSRYVTVCT